MPASFSANAIGFYLSLDADPMRKATASAEKDYARFVKRFSDQTDKLVSRTNRSMVQLSKTFDMFAQLPATAVASYAKAVTAVQRNIKPIKQPVEFVFGQQGDSFSKAVSAAVEDSLSRARFNLTPRTPGFTSRLSSPGKVSKDSKDYVGSVQMSKPARATPVKRHQRGGFFGRMIGHIMGSPDIANDTIAARDANGNLVAKINGNDVSVPRSIIDPMLLAAASPGVGRNGRKLNASATVGSTYFRRWLGENKEMASYANQMLAMRGEMDETRMYASRGIVRDVDRERVTRFRSLRAGYQSELSLMDPAKLAASSSIVDNLDASFSNISRNLDRIKSKSASVFSKQFWQTAAKNISNPMSFVAMTTALGRVGTAINRVAGEAPGSQEAFARYFAQSTLGSMQGGREHFARAFAATNGNINVGQMNNALTALMQNGYRGGSYRLAAGLAHMQAGYGFDAGVGSDIIASLNRRGGVGQMGAIAALASIGRNSQAYGAHGADVSAIIGGSGMLGAIEANRLRGGAATASIVGMSDFAARLFRAGGGDTQSRSATTNVMSMLSGVGQGDLSSLPALAMLGVGYGDASRFVRTGDSDSMLRMMKGRAQTYLDMDPIARAHLARQAGMDPRAFNTLLVSLTSTVTRLNRSVMSTADAMADLERSTSKATNFSDWMSSVHGRIGATLNAVTGGAVAAMPSMADMALTGASTAYLANTLTGGALSRWGGKVLAGGAVSPLSRAFTTRMPTFARMGASIGRFAAPAAAIASLRFPGIARLGGWAARGMSGWAGAAGGLAARFGGAALSGLSGVGAVYSGVQLGTAMGHAVGWGSESAYKNLDASRAYMLAQIESSNSLTDAQRSRMRSDLLIGAEADAFTRKSFSDQNAISDRMASDFGAWAGYRTRNSGSKLGNWLSNNIFGADSNVIRGDNVSLSSQAFANTYNDLLTQYSPATQALITSDFKAKFGAELNAGTVNASRSDMEAALSETTLNAMEAESRNKEGGTGVVGVLLEIRNILSRMSSSGTPLRDGLPLVTGGY